jgi:VWFA-related protein
MRLRLLVAAAGLLASLAPGPAPLAHDGQVPAPQAFQAPFRAATTTVEVDVIVRDNGGRFVTGLTPADFEVTEDGEPQQVHSMYLVEGRSVTRAARAGAGEAGPVAAPSASLSPPVTQRVFVLFFDQEHLDAGGFKRLQDAAVSFLTTEFKSGDVGGVLVGGTMIGNRLTTEREVLVQGVRGAKFSQSQAFRKMDLQDWPRITEIEATRIALVNDRDILDQVVRRAAAEYGATSSGGRGAGSQDFEAQVRSKASQVVSELRPAAARTIKTLLGLLNGLGRVPGRKTVVFMTDGFWVEESWGELRNIVSMAARGNVRFYSIDAQGLRRGGNTTDLNQMNPMETGSEIPVGAYNTIEDGPNSIAWDTGGYYIRRTNDFEGAFTEIAADTSTYYVLGYTPASKDFDGRFRQIKVTVKRDGVTVRARKGYLALAPAAAAPAPGAPPAGPTAPAPVATDPSPAPAPGKAGPAGAAPLVAPAAVRPAAATAAPAAPAAGAVPAAAGAAPVEPVALRPDSGGRVRELASAGQGGGPSAKLASDGWDRYGRGDLEGAERLLAQAAQMGAAPWVSYALGFAQVGLKKPGEALQAWERVRAAVPEFEPVYLDLADVYVQLDEPDRAVETLRSAEKRWPDDADVLNALGTIQVRRNALGDAIDTFEKAAKADPKNPLAYFNLGRTYELRYFTMRRFSRPNSRWVDNPELLNKAIENYEVCLRLGGPYEADARAAIDRLRNIR